MRSEGLCSQVVSLDNDTSLHIVDTGKLSWKPDTEGVTCDCIRAFM